MVTSVIEGKNERGFIGKREMREGNGIPEMKWSQLRHIVTVKVIKMEFAPSEKAGNGNILLTV